MPEITLFYSDESFFSQKARLYLKEKGVHFNETAVNLQDKNTLEPGFLEMNPNGEVPLLQHGDKYIPDSEQIMLYGEENFDGNILLPSEQHAEIMELHNMLHKMPIEILTYGSVLFPDLVENSQLSSLAKAKLKEQVLGEKTTDLILASMNDAPPEMVDIYQRKLKMHEMRRDILSDRTKVLDAIDKIEKALNTIEEHLTNKHKELGTTDPVFLFGRKLTIVDIDLSVLLARLRFIGFENKFFPKPSALNATFSGDTSQFCDEDIPRPAIRLYLDNFDKRKTFQRVVLKAYSRKSIMKLLLKNRLKDKNVWLIGAAIALTGAVMFYYSRRK